MGGVLDGGNLFNFDINKRAFFCGQALGAELRENTLLLVGVASCIGSFFA